MKKILHNFRIKHTRCRKDELHKSSLNVDIISKNLFNSQKINLLMSTTLFFENSIRYPLSSTRGKRDFLSGGKEKEKKKERRKEEGKERGKKEKEERKFNNTIVISS